MSNPTPQTDALLWEYPVRFDDAYKGLDITVEADDAIRSKLREAFGMTDLMSLKTHVVTRPKPRLGKADVVHLSVRLSAELTQECGVTLEPFTHSLIGELDVDCVQKDAYDAQPAVSGEHELTRADLDVPDMIEGGKIDLGLYIVEALGQAYDPFARKPGAVFEEPEMEKSRRLLRPYRSLSLIKGAFRAICEKVSAVFRINIA